jgi:pimeloyl-ACP methyl ester carboxylesterase
MAAYLPERRGWGAGWATVRALVECPYPNLAAGPDDGPVVLLLHGFPQTKTAWRAVLPVLGAAGLRAVAFDQRGYRGSAADADTPRRAYRLDALADDVLVVADALGAERVHVVGHDWGGAVAWKLASDAAARLASVTVVATPHPRAMVRSMVGMQGLRSLYIGFFQLPAVPELVLGASHGVTLRRLLRRSGLGAEHAAEYSAAMTVDGTLARALQWYRSNGPSSVGSVGPSRVPTLYVWPSDDVALGRAAAERTADHVDGPYRFVVFDGCAHWVPELRPEELAALVVGHVEAAS